MRSEATSLLNLEGGYKLSKRVKIGVDVFNLLNARDSDIDYYYASRLPGEPAGGVERHSPSSDAAADGSNQPHRGVLVRIRYNEIVRVQSHLAC